jgi:hypothetical protein
MLVVTKYKGLSSFYFYKIIDNIIEIGNLKNSKKTILDYGCGERILSQKLKNNKVLNFDLNSNYSDFKYFENLKFDIVVMNHVLMYMDINQINDLFDKFKIINSDCEFIIGLGKQNYLSKIAKNMSFNFDAHKFTKTTYEEQIKLLKKKMHIIKLKKNIYFMTDIYYLKFKY